MKPLLLMLSLLSMPLLAPAQWLSPQNNAHNIGAAHVEKVTEIPDSSMTAKLFHNMPIDAPSMNPWFLHLAVVNEDNNTWNVYPLANVSDYQILPSAQKGYLKIAVSKDDYNTQTGKPFQRKSLLFINLGNANRTNGKIETEEK